MFTFNRANRTERAQKNDKFAQLQEQLAALASADGTDERIAAESIADDTNLDENTRRSIERDEALVRQALGLFGVVYDDLIRMDEKSPYARALKMQPALLTQIANAENPVLAALEVAVGFGPYADFIQQYGQNPEEIKATLRQEIAAELKQASKQRLDESAQQTSSPTPFSSNGQSSNRKQGVKPPSLTEIFE